MVDGALKTLEKIKKAASCGLCFKASTFTDAHHGGHPNLDDNRGHKNDNAAHMGDNRRSDRNNCSKRGPDGNTQPVALSNKQAAARHNIRGSPD